MSPTNDEYTQESIMETLVVLDIEDSKENEASGANDSSYDCASRKDLLPVRCVQCKSAPVSKPTLEDEDQVKGHNYVQSVSIRIV